MCRQRAGFCCVELLRPLPLQVKTEAGYKGKVRVNVRKKNVKGDMGVMFIKNKL